jgi:hypothetical protein
MRKFASPSVTTPILGCEETTRNLWVEQPFLKKGGSGRGKAEMDRTLRYNIFT